MNITFSFSRNSVHATPRADSLSRGGRRLLSAVAFGMVTGFGVAQVAAPESPATTAAKPAASQAASTDPEVLELSPFQVNSSKDEGYVARETLSGTRLNTSLRDVSSQVSVMTPEFLQDIGVNTLEEALRYSLNSENPAEYYDATTANNTSLTLNPFSGGSRTRGLAASSTTHDLFPTYLPIDTYNTERFTLTSGPNAILFGSGNPAGAIDTVYRRARHDKATYGVELKADSESGWRTSVDLNQPIIPKIVSLRVAGVTQHDEDFRKPNFEDTDRLYATLTIDPVKWASARVWYEKVNIDRQLVRNTVVKDGVTPWIAAGSPIFNNGLGQTLPANSSTSTTAGYSPIFLPFTTTTPVYITGQTASTSIPTTAWTNTVYTRGHDTTLTGADGFLHSIKDDAVFPTDVNITGNGLQNRLDGWVRGASIELNPFKNFFIELGANEEDYEQRFVEFGGTGATTLQVDANQYLPDRVTPNPNVGRYYIQGTVAAGTAWNRNKNTRATASYDFNFQDHFENFARWFGRHRVAGMVARDRNWRILQRSVSSTTSGVVPLYRVYLDNPSNPQSQGVYSINLPGDPFETYTLPGSSTVIESPFASTATYSAPSTGAATDIKTRLFASQHYFWNDRVVLTYGRRVDDADGFTAAAARDSANRIVSSVRRYDTFGYTGNKELNTDLKGAVIHPFRWLSLHYNESNSQNPSSTVAINLDGSAKPSGDGSGKDFGVSFHLLDDRVTIRLNHYESILLDGLSTYRAGTGIGGINPFRDTVYNIEKSVLNAGAPINSAYASYENAVAANAAGTSFAGREVYDVSSNTRSKGYELEIVANPTKQWRVSLGGAETEASETKIARDWFTFIESRLPVWAQYASAPLHSDTSRTVRDYISSNVIASWNYILAQEGRSNPAIRKYRVNATTRYTFANGLLKNAFVGGSYIWRSKSLLGYGTQLKDPSELAFTYPGLTTGALEVVDPSRSYYGDPITNIDAFLGYSRKILRDRVQWRIQLNVRNIFDERDPLVQRVDSQGVAQVYNLVEPRTFVLTSSFSF